MQPMKNTTTEQADVPAGSCDPVETPHWSNFPGSACGPAERTPYWNKFADRACDPMGDPGFQKEFTLWRVFLLGQFVKDSVYTGVGSLRRKRERQCVINCLQSPFPVHLHCLGRGGGGIESEVESGKKGRREEGAFLIGFYYPILLLSINRFH